MKKDDRRGAERHSPPKPVPATFGGFAAKIIDVGLTGCRIEHTDRLPPRARLSLRFGWRGSQVRIDATAVRSELTSVGGKPAYISGLEFCDAPDASPPVIREIVGWLVAEKQKTEPPPIVHRDPVDEPEVLSASYLRCTLSAGQWTRLFVEDPAQPANGFTIPAPANDREADALCRAYEQSDPTKRQTMRATFQQKLRQPGRS